MTRVPDPSWIGELADRAPEIAREATRWALEDDAVDVEQLRLTHEVVQEHLAVAAAGDVPPAFSPRWHALERDDPRRDTALIVAAFALWAVEHQLAEPAAVLGARAEVSSDVCAALHRQRQDDRERWLAHDRAERADEQQRYRVADAAWDRFLARRRAQPVSTDAA